MGEASPATATYKVGGVHYGAEYIDTERVIELIGLGIVAAVSRRCASVLRDLGQVRCLSGQRVRPGDGAGCSSREATRRRMSLARTKEDGCSFVGSEIPQG